MQLPNSLLIDWEEIGELFNALPNFTLSWPWPFLSTFVSHCKESLEDFTLIFFDFRLEIFFTAEQEPSTLVLWIPFSLQSSIPSFVTRIICTCNSHLCTSSKMQMSPMFILLSRTKLNHPPQKVWDVCTLVVGIELTIQLSPFRLWSTIFTLQLGRCAVANWYGTFCIRWETKKWATKYRSSLHKDMEGEERLLGISHSLRTIKWQWINTIDHHVV